MIKRILGFLLITSILFLSACSLGGSRIRMLNKDNDEGKEKDRLEQIINAIKNQDKDSMKRMFSQQAQDITDDLDGQIDYLFEYIQGNIESWETLSGGVNESINNGHIVKGSAYRFEVKTDKQEYLFYPVECTENTDHPENVGLYVLQVMKLEDRSEYFHGGGPKTLPAGIDIPDASVDNGVTASPK